jgi:hypothetical protein
MYKYGVTFAQAAMVIPEHQHHSLSTLSFFPGLWFGGAECASGLKSLLQSYIST